VAEAEERIVGFALGRVMEKPRSAWRYGWLLWLGVEPHFKRAGVATRLLNQLTGRFIDRDARIMLVDTDAKNHSALGFFRRRGFGQEMRHVYLSQNLEDDPRYIERREAQRNGRAD
jgi:ribosomal protein S18 acetylase RimI-like enzyme